MAFCKNCGNRIDDKAVICPACGVAQGPVVTDNGGFGWGMLGFCIPIVGFILWLVWKNEKPNRASAVCTGAWISIAISFVLNLLSMMMGAF